MAIPEMKKSGKKYPASVQNPPELAIDSKYPLI